MLNSIFFKHLSSDSRNSGSDCSATADKRAFVVKNPVNISSVEKENKFLDQKQSCGNKIPFVLIEKCTYKIMI